MPVSLFGLALLLQVPDVLAAYSPHFHDIQVAVDSQGGTWWLPASAAASTSSNDAAHKLQMEGNAAGAGGCGEEPAMFNGAWALVTAARNEQ